VVVDSHEPNQCPHFFLVHGTWARGARWAQGSAVLPAAIRAKFDEVIFHILEWSGRNNDSDRSTAASRLETEIRAVQASFPQAPIFLIGHSHGGNVCVRAANRVPSLAGLVTLATPFVHISIPSKRRSLGQVQWRVSLLVFTPYLVVALAVLVISVFLFFHQSSEDPSLAVWRLWLYCLGVPFLIVIWRFMKILRHLTAMGFSRRARAIKRFEGFRILDTDVLAAYYSFDEAFRFLRFYERFNPRLGKLGIWMGVPAYILNIAQAMIFIGVGTLLFLFVLALMLLPRAAMDFLCSRAPSVCTREFGVDFVSLMVFAIVGSLALFVILMTVSAIAIAVGLALSSLVYRLMYSPVGFGISSLVDTALVDVSHGQLPQLAPGASAKVYRILLPVSFLRLWRALFIRYHMTIHSNPEIAEAIARWCFEGSPRTR
jgi:pimeloyl-ACP methyl ester carboxylesterase